MPLVWLAIPLFAAPFLYGLHRKAFAPMSRTHLGFSFKKIKKALKKGPARKLLMPHTIVTDKLKKGSAARKLLMPHTIVSDKLKKGSLARSLLMPHTAITDASSLRDAGKRLLMPHTQLSKGSLARKVLAPHTLLTDRSKKRVAVPRNASPAVKAATIATQLQPQAEEPYFDDSQFLDAGQPLEDVPMEDYSADAEYSEEYPEESAEEYSEEYSEESSEEMQGVGVELGFNLRRLKPNKNLLKAAAKYGPAIASIYPPAGAAIAVAMPLVKAAAKGNPKAKAKVAQTVAAASAGDAQAQATLDAIQAAQAVRAHVTGQALASSAAAGSDSATHALQRLRDAASSGHTAAKLAMRAAFGL